MKSILRMILGLPPESIGCAKALQIAEEECKRRGWKFVEPSAREGIKVITVRMNTHKRGGNVFITIDAFNGNIVAANISPM